MSDNVDEDAVSARTEGPTPQGGAYAIIYYLNNDFQPIEKKFATRFEIIEYDAVGQGFFSTLGSLNNDFKGI